VRVQSAIRSFVRTVVVADGVFAPGHLGELTQWVPFELVDDVVAATRSVQARVRDLPARVGVYFVLALALFAGRSYVGVWQAMVNGLAGLPGLAVASPSAQALGLARRRLGVAPVKALFEVLAGPLGRPRTPGVCYRGLRTVAFDGCSSIKAPDAVRGWLGSPRRWLGMPGYPTVMLVALVETGTRGLLAAAFGPGVSTGNGEIGYAKRLCDRLDASMLLLGDRAYDGNDFLRRVAATGAMFLVRAKCSRALPVLAVLADGSFLSRLDGLAVRVVQARVTAAGPDGRVVADDTYRLVTTLLDPRTDPAPALVRLYHERWEIESAYYALRHTMLDGRVLRSRTRAGLEQELWAVLTVYQLLRTAMLEATDAVGADPDRASFVVALTAARDQVTSASHVLPATVGADPDARIDLTGAIGRAVRADLLGPRRPRISVRKAKSPISRYPARPVGDRRPLTSTDISHVEIAITPPDPPPAPALDPVDRPGGLGPVLTVLSTDPVRAWHARDIAHHLGETNINSLATRLSRWAALGKILKLGRAVYRLNPLTSTEVT
jgi:hypothetical protein